VAQKIHLLPPQYKPSFRPVTLEDRHAALCRELEYLRSEIKRLKGVNSFKNETLLSMAGILEDQLREPKPLTIERVKRLISQLKGAVDREQGGLPG
jgi:hypothetical protein